MNEEQYELFDKKRELENKAKELAESNLGQFLRFSESHEASCMLMIKEWLNSDPLKYSSLLKILSQELDEDQQFQLFEKLTEAERGIWKENVDGFLKGEEYFQASKFLSEEVLRAMISPDAIEDLELVDLLLGLKVAVAIKYIDSKRKNAKVLLNLLNPRITAKILDSFDEETAGELIGESLTWDFNQVKDEFASFKKELSSFINDYEKNPFKNRMLSILPTVGPEKEKLLYKKLIENDLGDEVLKAGMKSFPSELVLNLPSELTKKIMQDYPMNKKVQLLASLPSDKKESFMKVFADKGSAAREMLDLEFENIQNDQIVQSRIKTQSSEIWKEYVLFAREAISKDTEFTSELEAILGDWITQMKQTLEADIPA